MKTAEDIESFLIRMELPYEEAGDGVWVVRGTPGVDALAISVADPVVVFRIKVMQVPKAKREELFTTLLKLNATELLHGAYGLEGENVILTDALQLENLDYNEFQATFDDITMAIANHTPKLAQYNTAA